MKMTVFILIFNLVWACSQSDHPPATFNWNLVNITPSAKDTISKYIETYPENAQFSLAIIDGDQINVIGMKRQHNHFDPVDNQYGLYEIGSITKTFTSALLAMWVSEGKIKLNASIAPSSDITLNPGEINPNKIRWVHLANHTSGLPRLPANMLKDALLYSNNPYKRYDQARLYKYLKTDLELHTEPGSTYSYSNLGAGLLGHLISKIAHSSYESLVLTQICEPLKLNNTGFKLGPQVIKGVNGKGKTVDNWEHNVLAGCHALKSNLHDMILYAHHMMQDTSPWVQLVLTPTYALDDSSGVALGWHYKSIEGHQVYWHNGGTGGYTSCLLFDPKNNKAVVMLSNVSALSKYGRGADQVAFGLMRLISKK